MSIISKLINAYNFIYIHIYIYIRSFTVNIAIILWPLQLFGCNTRG